VLVHQRLLAVTALEDEPIEGVYRRTVVGPVPVAFRLFVESSARGTTYLSGRYQNANEGVTRGLLGLLAGNDVTLVFLSEQLASDTVSVYRGKVQANGSLVGCFEGPREQRCQQQFTKQP
jgi:hypothetical protein